MLRINTISGGASSFVSALIDQQKHDDAEFILVFSDTGYEHPSTYKFIQDTLLHLRGDLVTLKSWDLWETFEKEGYQGNGLNAVCSRVLKQEPSFQWFSQFPKDTPISFGFDWNEEHRLSRAKTKYPAAHSPLLESGLEKPEQLSLLGQIGIEAPYLYSLGLSHNNCSGFCVKAGQGHYKLLLERDPNLYRQHEEKQESLIASLKQKGRAWDKVGFIVVQRRGTRHYLTLREFRRWLEAGKPVDVLDFGGCGCYLTS